MQLGRHSSLVNAWSARLQLQLPRPKQNCFDTHKAKHGLPWLSLNFTIAPAIWISGRHRELFVSMAHSAVRAMARVYKDQLHECRSFTSSVRGIGFSFWPGSADFDTVWRTLMFISLQPWVVDAYVGVTRCCRWRGADCAENGSMPPRRDRFQMMYPVCASYGESICALERLLPAKLVVSCPTVCAHGPSYRRGPLKARDATILYFCTRVIS